MSNRKLQTFDEYRYGPRSVLKPGDRFRVGGGPVYITNDGVEHCLRRAVSSSSAPTASRVLRNGLKLIPAGGGGIVLLWVGKACKSPVEPNLGRIPLIIKSAKWPIARASRRRPTALQNEDGQLQTAKKPRRKSKAAEISIEPTHA